MCARRVMGRMWDLLSEEGGTVAQSESARAHIDRRVNEMDPASPGYVNEVASIAILGLLLARPPKGMILAAAKAIWVRQHGSDLLWNQLNGATVNNLVADAEAAIGYYRKAIGAA